MSRLISWTLALLALPLLAVADVGTGSSAGQVVAEAEPAPEGSSAPIQAIPAVLDLRIREGQLPTGPEWLNDARGLGAAAPDPHSVAGRNSADKGLSFGLELKRRPQFENRTRPDEDEAPGLQGEVERLIERSTLGVRGIYRF